MSPGLREVLQWLRKVQPDIWGQSFWRKSLTQVTIRDQRRTIYKGSSDCVFHGCGLKQSTHSPRQRKSKTVKESAT